MYSLEEGKKLRLEFWNTFGRWCKLAPQMKGRQKSWILHHTGIPDMALKFEATRKDASVMIELTHRSENKRLEAFEILEKYKTIIEDGFSNGLTWEFYAIKTESGKEVCRIYTSLSPVDFFQRSYWPAIFNFFIDNMIILEKNFMNIQDSLKEDLAQLS